MGRLHLDPARHPVDGIVESLRTALADGGPGSAVVVAEPGAGKTTRLPLALLDQPWCSRLVLTAPRRLAALAAAERLASTLGERVGETVGIRMRDLTRVGPGTRIEVVTEGVLVRMLQDDPALVGVSAVVLDEVHERSLDIDLSLALVVAARDLLRPDLRVVAMSATVDDRRTAAVLASGAGPAPVLRAPGRVHPVEVRHVAPPPGRLLDEAATRALEATAQGDVLVFLAGAAEIRRTARALDRAGAPGRADVLVLHGAGSEAEHRAALAPPSRRPRIVLATSIAQTSLTIPGVRTVVDTGAARRSAFDPRSGVTRLVTVPASRATADQRAGRAGREAPGRCIRLWSSAEHARRPAHDPTEITTADLEPLVLALATWGTTDPWSLRWLDAPPHDAWDIASGALRSMGALTDEGRLTAHGAALARLPLHPRIGHLLLLAGDVDQAAARRAAALAVVLTRPDVVASLVPDERSLAATVERVAAARPPHRAVREVESLLASVPERRHDPGAPRDGSGTSIAGLLSLVHPERIATREGADPGRYRLASGGIATMHDDAPERGAPVVVVADLDGDRRNGRMWSCLVADPVELVRLHATAAVDDRVVVLEGDPLAGAVEGVERTTIGSAVLSTRRVDPRPDEIAAAVRDAIDLETLRRLLDSAEAASLCARVEAVRSRRGAPWPAMDLTSLFEAIDEWLAPALSRCPRRAPLQGIPVLSLLRDRVGRHLLHELDRLAPESVRLPSGATHRIDWMHEAGPTVTARVQELFGTLDGPRVLDGAVAIRLELTSPAGRPAAVTDDLRRFWTTGYPLVRAELRGRYPKHPWPDDPTAAQATTRAKARPPR